MEENQNKQENIQSGIKRRDLLKGLATLPVLGLFAYGWSRKKRYDHNIKASLQEEIKLNATLPSVSGKINNNKQIRLGIIGCGGRGRDIMVGAGFAHPERIDSWKEGAINNKADRRYHDFLGQEDLNIVINGICDVFDINADKAIAAASNVNKEGSSGVMAPPPVHYKTYKELINAEDIDAVIIATPDHWHGPMTIEAAKAGKHVYCEKPMTWTVPETYEVVNAVKENNIVFQLGHQNRQTEANYKAKEAVEKNVLGPINLIEVTTNRNSPNGAWVYKIDEEASPQNIDWDQFIGPAPYHDFSLERFFRWRCWWDYSTGLSGDLFTHDYDAMNQILNLGIPESAVSSGGIYYYNDGRTVPDVLQSVFEYPEKDLTLLYSASLSSSKHRGRVIMGHDAWMEVGNNLLIYADRDSSRYKEKIKDGIIDPSVPMYSFTPGLKDVDAITSPTEQYFAGRGLLYTYRGGKRVNTTFLHIKEWLDCIRTGQQPSCNIDQGFQEAITAHMGTIAYRENRKVFWDKENMQIV